MNKAICYSRLLTIVLLAGAWGIFPADLDAAQSNEAQQEPVVRQRQFASPDEAVKALQAATEAKDKAALNEIFGSQVQELLTGDEVQDAKNAHKFATILAQGYTLVKEEDDKITIEVGKNNWPMPIPLVKANGQWYFDTAAGKEEIINRHIGKDELHAIGVCRVFASKGVKYARKLPQPFHGYYFRILARQGLVAYPAYWDQSGVMTFIVNQEAQVYQRNLGENTSRIALAMKEYNPDNKWTLVQDEGVLDAVSEK
jgi:hypothetical protein